MTTKNIVLALSLAGALSAQASFTPVINNATVSLSGGSSTAYFTLTDLGSLNVNKTYYGFVATVKSSSITSPLVINSVSVVPSGFNEYVYGNGTLSHPITIDVNWTLPATSAGTYDYDVYLTWSTGTGGTAAPAGGLEVGIGHVTAAAPEPAQALAGAMLLGCGGLVFAGRRLFKKQAA